MGAAQPGSVLDVDAPGPPVGILVLDLRVRVEHLVPVDQGKSEFAGDAAAFGIGCLPAVSEPVGFAPAGDGALEFGVEPDALDVGALFRGGPPIRWGPCAGVRTAATAMGSCVATRSPCRTSNIVNDIGLPTVTVPFAYYADGTPFVLAFIGDLWSDANLLAWAYDLGRATMARVAPRLSELRGSGGGGRRSR